MLFDVVAFETGSPTLDALSVHALALPWTGWYSGVGMPIAQRRLRVEPREAEIELLRGRDSQARWHPDPASDGRSHLKVRSSLDWFPFEDDGTCPAFPLLARISILQATRFEQPELEQLHGELIRVVPHVTGDDALLFNVTAFLVDEVVACERGFVEFRPGMLSSVDKLV